MTQTTLLAALLLTGPLFAQPAPPKIPFDSNLDFLKLTPQMNLGEVLGISINSKGHVVVLNHPGSATSGPLYGNASTQLLEFDENGKRTFSTRLVVLQTTNEPAPAKAARKRAPRKVKAKKVEPTEDE